MKHLIIAHRGASGLALENSLPSFKKALELGAHMIELDVRLTSDNELIVSHDPDLGRVSGDNRKIRAHTYKELQDIRLKDGSRVLSLADALAVVGTTPVMIELKDTGSEAPLLAVLAKFPAARVSVASFKIAQLGNLRKLHPELPLYALAFARARNTVTRALKLGLTGVGLHFWIINPLSYGYATRSKLDIYTYTVNNYAHGRLLQLLFPSISICTNYPNKFIQQ